MVDFPASDLLVYRRVTHYETTPKLRCGEIGSSLESSPIFVGVGSDPTGLIKGVFLFGSVETKSPWVGSTLPIFIDVDGSFLVTVDYDAFQQRLIM